MSRWYHFASAFFVLQAMQALGFIDRLIYGEWVGKGGDRTTQSLRPTTPIHWLSSLVGSVRR